MNKSRNRSRCCYCGR